MCTSLSLERLDVAEGAEEVLSVRGVGLGGVCTGGGVLRLLLPVRLHPARRLTRPLLLQLAARLLHVAHHRQHLGHATCHFTQHLGNDWFVIFFTQYGRIGLFYDGLNVCRKAGGTICENIETSSNK